MRYCVTESCRTWYHINCLGEGTYAYEINWANERRTIQLPSGLASGSRDTSIFNWELILRCPIERIPRCDEGYNQEPYTLEVPLQALQDVVQICLTVDPTGANLPNFNQTVQHVVEGSIGDIAQVERVVEMIQRIQRYYGYALRYNCPVCGRKI